MRISFLFLSLFASLLANDFEPPTPQNIHTAQEQYLPRVNIVSGEYYEQASDLVVAGIEPLSYNRFYNQNASYDARYGGWRLNPESYLVANFEWKEKPQLVLIGEDDGGMTLFYGKTNRDFFFNQKTQTPHTQGCSGQTHPLNTTIHYEKLFDPKNKHRFAWLGETKDGSGRTKTFATSMHTWFKTVKVKGKKRDPHHWTPYQCQIKEERLPNGNCLCYKYDRVQDDKYMPTYYYLKEIQAYNRYKTKLLNKIQIDYQIGKEGVLSIQATGSDGRVCQSQHKTLDGYSFTFRSPTGKVLKGDSTCQALAEVQAPGQPKTTFKHEGILSAVGTKTLSEVVHPNQRRFVTKADSATRKVSKQLAPLGQDGQLEPLYTFSYGKKETTLLDALNQKTLYKYDDQYHITSIETHDATGCLLKQNHTYDKKTGNLLSQTFEDHTGQTPLAIHYTYDKNHNAIEETIKGNLSGEDPSDTYTLFRTFSNDGFNLKLSETDGGSKKTLYTYLPNTNLLTRELIYEHDTIQKRTFYTYDDCAVPIKKIVDNGSGLDPHDLTDVTYRLITYTTPKQEIPCLGLPEIVTEKTLDAHGHEILLHKTVYTYHPSGKIALEEHYDANNTYCYTIENTYNEEELLIQTQDPLGHITAYTYDDNHNLVSVIGPNPGQEKRFVYDFVNRPIEIHERQSDGTYLITQKHYDKLGQLTQEISPLGETTF